MNTDFERLCGFVVLVTWIVVCVSGCPAKLTLQTERHMEPGAKASALKSVPEEYRPLYNQLSTWLDDFQEINQEQKSTSSNAPVFGAHLQVADANRGPVLLSGTTMPAVELSLDRYESLGVQGITVVIGYPMLLDEFPDSERYIVFYEKVAKAIQKRNMKLLVEQNVLFVNSEFTPYTYDFSDLTFETFVAKQRRMTEIIIEQMNPDYMTILHEPQTFAVLADVNEFYKPEKAVEYVKGVLDGLDKKDCLIGAGAGNWDDLNYFRGIAHTDADYLSLHIYPIDPHSIRNAYAIADIAKESGKSFVLTEGWLYKSNGKDDTAHANLAGWEAGFRRDFFSFWEPLDQRYLKNYVCFARATGVVYASPYWSNYMISYLEYDEKTKDLSYKELVRKAFPKKFAASLLSGKFTKTGQTYAALINGKGLCQK